MKKLFLVLFSSLALAQQPVVQRPDCLQEFAFTAVATFTTFDNRVLACNSWTMSYTVSSGFGTSLSIVVQGSNDASSWADFEAVTGGSLVSGSNPNTATTHAISQFAGYLSYVRVNLTAANPASGLLVGTLYGWKVPATISATISGSVSTSLTSAAVAQTDASTNSPRVLVDGSGNAMTNPSYGFYFNGVTWDRAKGNTLGAFVQGPQLDGAIYSTSNPVIMGMINTSGRVQTLVSGGDDYGLAVMLGGTSASIALADGQSNTQKFLGQSVSSLNYLAVPTFGYQFNGTSWDRFKGSTNGTWMQGPAASGAAKAGNPVQIGGVFNSTQPTVTTGQAVEAQFSSRGTYLVTPGVEGFPLGGTATTATTPLTSYLTSAATTNSTNVKNAAGNVYAIRVINTTATIYYLRMYNLASAPTCSSATGFIESIPIPASASGAGVAISQPLGQAYTTGIGFCLTAGGSSTDNTAAATGVYITILYF